jgi:c(7)-type cytochrome triheme protein
MRLCTAEQLLAMLFGLYFCQTTLCVEPTSKVNSYWLPLAKDELHDPADPALKLLKNPVNELSALPPAGGGNQVNWVRALENGDIKPRLNLHADTQAEVLDLDVLFRNTNELGFVNFPHKQHTEWLVCSNCHEDIFKSKAGVTKFGMIDILNGEYCGRCHGAIAFPPTECNRCHNVPRKSDLTPSRAK